MGNFFKKVGTGFLVLILSPFIAAFFVLFAVYAIFKFIILWVIAISKFFVGERISDPMDIDRKAAEMFEEDQMKKKTNANMPADAGKFAGATINIYANQEAASQIMQNIAPGLETRDVVEISSNDPLLLEDNNND